MERTRNWSEWSTLSVIQVWPCVRSPAERRKSFGRNRQLRDNGMSAHFSPLPWGESFQFCLEYTALSAVAAWILLALEVSKSRNARLSALFGSEIAFKVCLWDCFLASWPQLLRVYLPVFISSNDSLKHTYFQTLHYPIAICLLYLALFRDLPSA